MPGVFHPPSLLASSVGGSRSLIERPQRGRVSFRFSVGAGASRDSHRTSELIAMMAEQVIAASRVLVVGDVSLRMIWMSGERDRHDAGHVVGCADVLAPVMAVMCGPRGLVVHGAQVRSVTYRQLEWSGASNCVACVLRFAAGEWLWKKELHWVALTDTLCLPLNRSLPAAMQHLLLDVWEGRVDSHRACAHLAADDEVRACAGPGLRPVRRSHLTGFEVRSAEEMRAMIQG